MIIARTDLRGVVTWTSEDAARLGFIPGARLGNQPDVLTTTGRTFMSMLERAITDRTPVHEIIPTTGLDIHVAVTPSSRGALLVAWCPGHTCTDIIRAVFAARAKWREAQSASRRSPPA
jgi:hypothetical protein